MSRRRFQYGGYQPPAMPPMPQMPDLARQLALLRQAGLTGQDQMSPMDVLNEMKAFGTQPDTTTKPTRTLEESLMYDRGVDASTAERQMGLQNGLQTRPPDQSYAGPTNPYDPWTGPLQDFGPEVLDQPLLTDLASAKGGRFRDPGEYTPAKKAKGGILIRRPRPAAVVAQPPEDGSRSGGADPRSPGHHLPIPVISTTIIIAHKKPSRKSSGKDKEQKMARGGKVRGAGIARRGTRFSGIF